MGSGRRWAAATRARPPPREPVKPTALTARIADQGQSELVARALQQGERPLRKAVLDDSVPDGATDELGRSGMGRMALDDHRAAGGQRRGGVAAGDREGQREVAGPEDGDRTERDGALPQIGARKRQPVGQGSLDAHLPPGAVADERREQPQLTHGAGGLPRHPGGRQSGFGHDSIGERRSERLDVRRDAVQEGGPLFGGGPAIAAEGLRGQGGGPIDLGRAGFAVLRLQLGAGGRVNGPETHLRTPPSPVTGVRPARPTRRRRGRSAAVAPARPAGR